MNRRAVQKTVWKRLLIFFVVLCVLLGGLAAGGIILWQSYGDQISRVLGWNEEETDYEGDGEGELLVTISSGQIGSDVANMLEAEGVVKDASVFYQLLLKQEPAVVFHVGTYRVKEKMSSQAALDALLDPANLVEYTVAVPEGLSAEQALTRASDVMEIPFEEFEALMDEPQQFGIPDDFDSVEGYLFPATYVFAPEDTAESIIQTMVDRMDQVLDQHGVAPEDAFDVLTLASVVQREAGSNPEDFKKVARVFLNRLDIDMKLQSDATVTYGTGNSHTVWTTPEERADASNPYNTYANPGLPIGPIGLPGDVAIDAVVNPAEGDWLYFVTVNLSTGETKFSSTHEQHEEAVQELGEWCTAHRDEGGKRCD